MNSPSRGERIDAPLPQSGLQSRLFDFRPLSLAEGCGRRLVLAGCSPSSSWSCASTASVTALICLGFACRVPLWHERAILVERRSRVATLLPPRMAARTARTQYDCFSWLSNSKVSKSNSSKNRLDSGKSEGSKSASRSISSSTCLRSWSLRYPLVLSCSM